MSVILKNDLLMPKMGKVFKLHTCILRDGLSKPVSELLNTITVNHIHNICC